MTARVVCWFSCGTPSAVAAKLAVAQYGETHEVVIARTAIPSEHPDNDRFADDIATWLGRPVLSLRSDRYDDIWDVWEKRRYLAGPKGALCTTEMKKMVRHAYQRPDDIQVFGYAIDANDVARAKRFREQNFEVDLRTPLIDAGLSKADCHALIRRAGIELPAMYRLGYRNNNCFSGDTEFITDVGVRTLRDAVGKTVRVRGVGGGWTPATVRSFGVQPLLCLRLRRNNKERIIHTTAGHRWFVKQYVHAIKSERTTTQLRPGDKLRSIFGRLGHRVRPSAFGVAQGIVFGDGTRGNTLNTAAILVLCGKKNEELLQYFPLSPRATITTGIQVRDLPRFWKDLPNLNDSQSFLYGWLAGYFAADGAVHDGEYILSSAKRENLVAARDVATRLGIGCNAIRRAMRTGTGKEPSPLYGLPFIGATLREDFFLIAEHRRRFAVALPRDPHPWTVVAVEESNRAEEVFCAVVPKGRAFVLEGNILTGNCIGCVKGGAGYWNKIRVDFPDVFDRMAALQRKLGATTLQVGGKRIYLDELKRGVGRYKAEPDIECSLLCAGAV